MLNPLAGPTDRWTRKRFLTDVVFVAGALVAAVLVSNHMGRALDEQDKRNREREAKFCSQHSMPGR